MPKAIAQAAVWTRRRQVAIGGIAPVKALQRRLVCRNGLLSPVIGRLGRAPQIRLPMAVRW